MDEPKKYSSAPKEINSVFGDEAHEVEAPKEINSEELNKQLRDTDAFDD